MNEQLTRLTEMSGQGEWQQYYSPVHPKYFFRIAMYFLCAAFFIFSAFLM